MGLSLPLMAMLSPAFPVGAFAYSHGLEWAHEAGDLVDAETLAEWLADLLAHGAPKNDAVLLAAAYRAAQVKDAPTLASVAELALALSTSAERRLETASQGDAFLAMAQQSWPCEALARLAAIEGPVAYPVAVGVAAAGHRLLLAEALAAFGLAGVSNLASAAIRLGVVGQTDGQKIIARLVPAIEQLAAFAESSDLDDLGGAAFRSDLAAMRHETQYTRLFRS